LNPIDQFPGKSGSEDFKPKYEKTLKHPKNSKIGQENRRKSNSQIETQEEVIEKVTTIKRYDSEGKPKEERVEKVTKRKITTFQNSGSKKNSKRRDICPGLDFTRSISSSEYDELSNSAASRLTKIKEDSRE
jgi:hypothetical protein